MGMITLMMVMMRTATGGVVLTEESVNDADCVYGEECIPSLKRNLDVFVPIAKCIFSNCKMYFSNCKMYFSQLQTVFVPLAKCIYPNCKMYFFQLQTVFLPIAKCISPNCKMYLSKCTFWFDQRILRQKCVNPDDKHFDRKSKIIGFQLLAGIVIFIIFSFFWKSIFGWQNDWEKFSRK